MNPYYDKLLSAYESLREKTSFEPVTALVLGSGLGGYADEITVEDVVEYQDIDGFPVSTVPGHKGRCVFGYVKQTPVVVMQGRIHYYEGYDIHDVVLPIRLMKVLGAENLILTNAAGGIQEGMKPGDFMMIQDHITQFVPSPLVGPNVESLGERFPDMSQVYDPDIQKTMEQAASRLGIILKKGVYIQFTGPNFETPAEIRMAKALGASAVGMSTAVEAMAAKHMGMRIGGISVISNLASGISSNPLSHEEVQIAADEAAPYFKQLLTELIPML